MIWAWTDPNGFCDGVTGARGRHGDVLLHSFSFLVDAVVILTIQEDRPTIHSESSSFAHGLDASCDGMWHPETPDSLPSCGRDTQRLFGMVLQRPPATTRLTIRRTALPVVSWNLGEACSSEGRHGISYGRGEHRTKCW